MDLENLASSIEDLTDNARKSGDQIRRKCYRKGDVICYAKPENINMFHKQSQKKVDSESRPSLESDGHTDTINSGESLFKAFTFEQSPNDEDTEKCIAFWKSVMEKNLSPIKCTIIENTKNRSSITSQEEKSEEEEVNESNDNNEDVSAKIHEEYRNMWLSALREIQKKKLNEVELTHKTRCKMCDSITSPAEQYVQEVDERAIKKDIKELNNWKPVSTKKQIKTSRKIDERSTSSTDSSIIGTSTVTKRHETQKSQYSKRETSENVKSIFDKSKAGEAPDSIEERASKNRVPDTKTYVYKDVIAEKKKNGDYSKWRSNAVKNVCNCKNEGCRCNINPAVIAIEKNKSNLSLGAINTYRNAVPKKNEVGALGQRNNSVSKCTEPLLEKKPEQCANKEGIQVDSFRSQSTRALMNNNNPSGYAISRKRTLSLFLQCTCSNTSCDCASRKEILSRTPEASSEWVIPKRTVVPLEKRRSSLEIYKKTLSRTKTLDKTENEQSSIQIKNRVPDETSIANETDANKDSFSPETYVAQHKPSSLHIRGSRKLGKSISLMLKTCYCSNKDCDCYEIEQVHREPSIIMNQDTYDIPKRIPVKRVDSLEVIKKRVSSILDPDKLRSLQLLYPPYNFDDNTSN
nr:uncharacterized protein LOC111501814 isoform X1 [Leptinotarsa decemlineata]